MKTRFATWNVSHTNKKLNGLNQFISTYNPDIICLQEVPLTALGILETYKNTYPNIFTAVGFNSKGYRNAHTRLVVMIKNNLGFCEFVSKKYGLKLTKKLWHRFYEPVQSEEFMVVDIMQENGKKMRIYNFHLPLHITPSERIEFVSDICRSADSIVRNVMLGDFNPVFDGKRFKNKALSLVLPLGSEQTINEQEQLNDAFKSGGFMPVIKHTTTHRALAGIVRQQLDYIAVPRGSLVLWACPCAEITSSDHYPLIADVDI